MVQVKVTVGCRAWLRVNTAKVILMVKARCPAMCKHRHKCQCGFVCECVGVGVFVIRYRNWSAE